MKQFLIAPQFCRPILPARVKTLPKLSRLARMSSISTLWITTTFPTRPSVRWCLKHCVTTGSPRPLTHLMVKPVDRIVPDFAAAGASIITFHPEASEHVDRTLQLIKENGCKAGWSLTRRPR